LPDHLLPLGIPDFEADGNGQVHVDQRGLHDGCARLGGTWAPNSRISRFKGLNSLAMPLIRLFGTLP
jgi:hypothetical protein